MVKLLISVLLHCVVMQRMLSTNEMDTITMATRCVLSVLVGWEAVAEVDHIVVEAVVMVVVIVMARVVDSRGQLPPLAVLTIEFMCLVR